MNTCAQEPGGEPTGSQVGSQRPRTSTDVGGRPRTETLGVPDVYGQPRTSADGAHPLCKQGVVGSIPISSTEAPTISDLRQRFGGSPGAKHGSIGADGVCSGECYVRLRRASSPALAGRSYVPMRRGCSSVELTRWIEGWFNPRRLHSTLDYNSPIEIENLYYRRGDGIAA